MRELKASRLSFAFTMSEEEGIRCHCESAHRLATAANILGWAGDPTEEEVASVIKGGLRRGKCQYDKQALLIFLGRLQLGDAEVVVYKGTKLHVPAAELGKELVWKCTECRTCHLDKKWHEAAWKCGVGSVVHRRKSDRSHRDAAVLCAGVSVSWARPMQQPTESWVSRRVW